MMGVPNVKSEGDVGPLSDTTVGNLHFKGDSHHHCAGLQWQYTPQGAAWKTSVWEHQTLPGALKSLKMNVSLLRELSREKRFGQYPGGNRRWVLYSY